MSNQDNARLTSELGRAQTARRETQGQLQSASAELANARGPATSIDRLTRDLAVSNRDIEVLRAERDSLALYLRTSSANAHALEVELASARGATASAREIVESLMKQLPAKRSKAAA